MKSKFENFIFFNANGTELKVSYGYLIDDIFKLNLEKDIQINYNSSSKGAKWTFLDKNVVINKCRFAYPSVDEKFIIAIYPLEDIDFPSPNNAVIYNLDGSIHKVLSPPKLISELAIKRLGKDNPPMAFAPDSIYFNHVNWQKDSSGNVVTSIWIGYDREWHENRELNPHTGEFGQCLGSGRL